MDPYNETIVNDDGVYNYWEGDTLETLYQGDNMKQTKNRYCCQMDKHLLMAIVFLCLGPIFWIISMYFAYRSTRDISIGKRAQLVYIINSILVCVAMLALIIVLISIESNDHYHTNYNYTSLSTHQ